MDPGFEFSYQVISQVDQNSASKSQPYLSIKISTKHLPQSLDQTSTSKNLPKFNLKVFNENILQNHDQTLVSKPWQYLALKAMTKIKVLILYQTSASKSWPNCRQHSINISNTNNLNSTQVKSVSYFNNSSQLVSEWVNQSVSDKKDRTWVNTMCASTCRKSLVSICHLTRASYMCEHVLHTRASTCFLHVRARYLFVRARLLFKNVRPGPPPLPSTAFSCNS